MNQIKIGLKTYQVVQISGYPYQFHNLYEKTTANLSFFGQQKKKFNFPEISLFMCSDLKIWSSVS
jgi:hypothetical protein